MGTQKQLTYIQESIPVLHELTNDVCKTQGAFPTIKNIVQRIYVFFNPNTTNAPLPSIFADKDAKIILAALLLSQAYGSSPGHSLNSFRKRITPGWGESTMGYRLRIFNIVEELMYQETHVVSQITGIPHAETTEIHANGKIYNIPVFMEKPFRLYLNRWFNHLHSC